MRVGEYLPQKFGECGWRFRFGVQIRLEYREIRMTNTKFVRWKVGAF
jgi:hypothetical protein